MASTNTFKRRELKFLLSESQKEAFVKDVETYIQADEFRKYTICNVYMDTPDSRLIRKSIEKPVYKEKMRVRSYGVAKGNSKVFVELKKKYQGIVYKRRVTMPLDEAQNFIDGQACRNGQIEEEIDYFIDYYKGIMPAMYIAYDRQAFKGIEDEQLRVTFDDHILWRDEDISLSSEVYGKPVLKEGQSLMEIKCGDAMPLWLTRALSNNRIYKTSFSKYGKAYLSQQKMEESQCLVH